jgi:hypothetical protein
LRGLPLTLKSSKNQNRQRAGSHRLHGLPVETSG